MLTLRRFGLALTALLMFAVAGLLPAATTVLPQKVTVDTQGALALSTAGDYINNVVEPIAESCNLTYGTGTGKVNLAPLISKQTLGTSASVTFDLTSYADLAGNSVTTMTKVKYVRIKNAAAVATIDVGGAAATQFVGAGFLKDATDIVTLAAGQSISFCVPVGITASGTVKSLKILNNSGAATAPIEVIVVGSST